MKKSVFIASLFLVNIINGQNTIDPSKRFSLDNISIIVGQQTMQSNQESWNNYQSTYPGSSILKMDNSGYNYGYYHVLSTSPFFNITISFKDQKSALNRYVRFGLVYNEQNNSTTSWSKYETFPYDTLSSNQTNNQLILDSVVSSNFYFTNNQKNLLIDFSYLLKTNYEKRWNLYAGLGISTGLSLKNYTNLMYGQYTSITHINSTNTKGSSLSEYYTNKNAFVLNTYVPLGISWQTGKKRDFFKALELFYEFRPFMQYNANPLLSTKLNIGLQQGFGIRVKRLE